MLTFPDISPIAFELGPLVVRWYALSYVVGILLGYRLVSLLNRRVAPPLLTEAARENLVLYAVLGIMLGGRLGYVLFYNAAYYFQNPADILALWHGGMSFHGGFIGTLVAFFLFAGRYKIRWLSLMDLLAVAAPIGLFLGRLANFVNGELFGRVTESPLGMVFPRGGPLPRHPSQLYEAGLEGALLFVILILLATRTSALKRPGLLGGVFVAGYGVARFTVEFFREPDVQLGLLAGGLSMGQLLCLPMMAVGLFLILRAKRLPV